MKELGLYNSNYRVSADNVFFTKMLNHNKKFVDINNIIISFRNGGFSNQHIEVSTKECIEGYYQEYGKYHNLSPLDISLLIHNRYLHITLEDAIKLGCKLDTPEWRKQFFSILINHKMAHQPVNLKLNTQIALKYLLQKIFSIKSEYSQNKKRKVVTLLGLKLKIKCKNKGK